jgi:hypothetical protein
MSDFEKWWKINVTSLEGIPNTYLKAQEQWNHQQKEIDLLKARKKKLEKICEEIFHMRSTPINAVYNQYKGEWLKYLEELE